MPEHSPAPGERWPYTRFETENGQIVSSYALIYYAYHHLFVYIQPAAVPAALALKETLEQVLRLQVHLVTPRRQAGTLSCDRTTFSQFNSGGSTVYLVRPDAYVGLSADVQNLKNLPSLLQRYFSSPTTHPQLVPIKH
ncbi:MAG: hypothetical protein AAFR42_16210 [Cyanobacteria bacterium J06628_6]